MIKKNWTEIKKELGKSNKQGLIYALQEMYKLNKANKDFMHLKFLAASNPGQKKAMLEETLSLIQKKWREARHDPYGYEGSPTYLKITPIKTPLINYKKALGEDGNYALVLAVYATSGIAFLKKHYEYSSTAQTSIDSILAELFKLIEKSSSFIEYIPIELAQIISTYMGSGHAGDNAFKYYYDGTVFEAFEQLKNTDIFKLEYSGQDYNSKPIYLDPVKLTNKQLMLSACLIDIVLHKVGYINHEKHKGKFTDFWSIILTQYFGARITIKQPHPVILDYSTLIKLGDPHPDMFEIESELLDPFKCTEKMITQTILNS